jgi:hypothetical protein
VILKNLVSGLLHTLKGLYVVLSVEIKTEKKLSVVVHTYNTSTWEVEARGLQV